MVGSPCETRLYFGCPFLFAAIIRPIGESTRAPTVRSADGSAIFGSALEFRLDRRHGLGSNPTGKSALSSARSRPPAVYPWRCPRSLEPSTAVPIVPAPPASGGPFTAMTGPPVNSVPDG
ncbi:hypothetical protein FGF80_01040 [Natrinema pallidum]|uniref:Uncharacterized protein n=1 Tax=Natrinema pallidum TaxID=69527 RepID=A0A4P9TBB8_9EURY|nr:hypothetical protein FGF80_01040 [Natrinema pallidum]